MQTVTAQELEERYGTATERRVELHERFQQWCTAARQTGSLQRVWIFGSFATSKPGPGDLDILALFAQTFDPANVPSPWRHWFDHALCREIHEIDLFWVTDSLPSEALQMVIETFGRDRNGQESILEVIL